MEANLRALFETIWGEARGEGLEGMRAVANVILNRADIGPNHPHFGDGCVYSACHAPWQFSCHNPNDANCAALPRLNPGDNEITALCYQVAVDALNGNLDDNTNGATYYYAKGYKMPAWAFGKDPCKTINHHIFFKDIA